VIFKSTFFALSSPLLNNNEINGAKNVLLNITSGECEATMDEIGQISDYVQDATGSKADMIFGSCTNPALGSKISVTIIATGFGTSSIPELNVITPKARNQKPEIRNQKPETINHKPETINLKPETINSNISFEQKSIDFNENNISENNVVTNPQNTLTNPQKQTILTDLDNNDEIDKLSNIPAYLRQNIVVEDKNFSTSSDKSSFTINKTKNGTQQLRENNSYLHDNVD